MKKLFFISFVLILAAYGAYSEIGGRPKAGTKVEHKVADVSFNMVYLPGGITFPKGLRDEGTATVRRSYWIGETPVTYELWHKVRAWAEENGYKFANPGREGSRGEEGSPPTLARNEPVTSINWRDAIAWSNAATEWYNSINKTNYVPVYYSDRRYTKPIKKVDNSDDVSVHRGSQDNPYVNSNANGFRLLTSDEWELAARYVDGKSWLPGNHASGAKAPYTDDKATRMVAWFGGVKTQDVKSLAPNAIGLYDMSGNVWSWCFDRFGSGHNFSYRVVRGGSWGGHSNFTIVGDRGGQVSFARLDSIGFILSRTDHQ